ncbi:CHAT domain-containing protein [Amycolatopsis sp. WAC 01375]|uniref:CHAT domain-containing protein n=1 Tax=Amycolatopsis sp. WAC 01375 TaxID=2203194 RepID=UPI000F7763E1|nr:CHAT domain-containing protein [Amycolatopsis sp. WAC 01375]
MRLGLSQWQELVLSASARYDEYARAPDRFALLDQVIVDLRRCLLVVPSNEAEGLAMVLSRLGAAICMRWQAEGGERLAEGIDLLTRASEGPFSNPEERRIALSNLGAVLLEAKSRALGTAAVCAAIEIGGSAVKDPAAEENLGHNQLALFEDSGDTTALLESLRRFENAVKGTPADGADRARRLCGQATAISRCRQVLGERYDRVHAVALMRSALAMTPTRHPDEPMMFDRLSSLLLAEFRERPELASIEEAAALSARAVDESTGFAERSAFQINRIGVLLAWAKHIDSPEVLDLADEVSEHVLQALPLDHALTSDALHARGIVEVLKRCPERAVDHFKAAARVPASPLRRIAVARKAAAMAGESGMWRLAADVLAHAVALLPALASRGLVRFDQERLLASYHGLAREACAYAVQTGDVIGGLLALERGRGVLFKQVHDDQVDMEPLRRVRPDLAARYDDCRAVLALPPSDDSLARDRIHAAADEMDRILDEARSVPGLERVFAPLGSDELREAAVEGPVVVVNVASLRTDALIITVDGVEVVPLPQASAPIAQEQFRAFIRASGDGGSCPSESLAWLWDAIVKPVLERLGIEPHSDDGPWRRVWWSPTGPLVFFPLHAAEKNADSVLDRVMSSYTATVADLVRTRRRSAVPPGEARLVVVAAPEVPGAKTLKRVADELAAIRAHVGKPQTELYGDQATRAAVLEALTGHERAHLACHAAQNVRMPTAGCLVLTDHEESPLTVRDIARLNLTSAEFAYLSACATGRGGIALTEEAVHLASAFQVAGYRHVVATLWPIWDAVAPVFAEAVYKAIAEGGVDAVARAVHETARLLRGKKHPPIVWAAHFHMGP